MRIPVAEINGEVYLEKDVDPVELPSIIIPCESEKSLKIFMDQMTDAGLFDEGNVFMLKNVSQGFLNKLNEGD